MFGVGHSGSASSSLIVWASVTRPSCARKFWGCSRATAHANEARGEACGIAPSDVGSHPRIRDMMPHATSS